VIAEHALNVFTDGSSLRSPRSGGIGIRFVIIDPNGDEQSQDVQFTGYRHATNNQMELRACIVALDEAIRLHLVDNVSKVIVYSDSLYVVDNLPRAMFQWPKTRWLSTAGRPILNADLWKQLIASMRRTGKRVEFKWVKGHAKSIHNKAADKMARQSANIPFNPPLSLVHVRRKLSAQSVQIGSVPMEGQRLSIRVITTEYLRVQKLWKCKYEVISKGSPLRSNIDIVFSGSLLKAGHAYYVLLNRETRNPRVVRVFKEIETKTR